MYTILHVHYTATHLAHQVAKQHNRQCFTVGAAISEVPKKQRINATENVK